jgi:hypothetical protein
LYGRCNREGSGKELFPYVASAHEFLDICRIADPVVINQIQHELPEFPVVAVRSIYGVLAMISDPRYDLLIAQQSLIEGWAECIAGQRPAMPIVAVAEDPLRSEWHRRTLRAAVTALTERWFLDLLASMHSQLRVMI